LAYCVRSLYAVGFAGEFEYDSRQENHDFSKGHSGLANLSHGNTLPFFCGTRKLIALCCSLLGASAGRGLEAATSAFLLNTL
jgi:hypothetical protein